MKYWIGNLMQYITLLHYRAIKCSALAWCMKWSYSRLSIFHIQCSIFKALLWLSMSHIPHSQGFLIHIPYIQGFLIHIQGSLGALHRLQLCDQPFHISPLQLKFSKSTDDHQVFQITFRAISLSKTFILKKSLKN